jgi:predicted 3-demethylubiquinone-9 3-methyltransferase (glyoxalase superfamily)
MTLAFDLDGQTFTALNGGPLFTSNEAIPSQVRCETREDVDYFSKNSPQAEMNRHNSAAGSKSGTACHGRRCSRAPMLKSPNAS